MTQTTPPTVWKFRPAADRSDLTQVRNSNQLNSDEFRKVTGYRLEKAQHTGEPTQIWKWGSLAGLLVSETWFKQANALMREAGFDHADEAFEPLPARTDSATPPS